MKAEFILVANIQGISIIGNEFSIGGVDLDFLEFDGLRLDLREWRILMDTKCNISSNPRNRFQTDKEACAALRQTTSFANKNKSADDKRQGVLLWQKKEKWNSQETAP